MKTILTVLFTILMTVSGFAQTKNFIDQPYLETTAQVDTLVVPDKIFLSILITESDTKGKQSVEEQENQMAKELKALGINLDKQLTLSDLSSNFKKYFLKKQDILKSKSYSLVVYDAKTAGLAIMAMEDIGISNIELEKTEYSKLEELLVSLKANAVKKARIHAEAMLKPLNQKVVKAIYISDTNSNPINTLYGRAAGIQMAYNDEFREKFQPIAIEFEKIKIESQVHIKFSIE